jgi:exodeoxyribonuclease V alpha subunit
VALAAPTGKAAVRMAESLKSASPGLSPAIRAQFETITPLTIHRLLKSNPDSPYFRFNKENPLNYDVVIVDESSMIDVALFAKLLNAVGENTKLILLGDKDQLASVEAGSLFGDLCKSQPSFQVSPERAALINLFITDPKRQITGDLVTTPKRQLLFEQIVELKGSHRFRSDEGIGKFSKTVINGNIDQLQSFLVSSGDEQVQIDTKYDEKVFEAFIKGYKEYIREPDIRKALKKFNSLRVLCAVREGDHGLYTLNKRVEKYLQQNRLIKPTSEFYEHRPVIVMKNHYDINLFNGDVGIMRYDENQALKAWFEDSSGELKSILPGFISEAETVYAMTIHKSQGSEFDRVLVVLPDLENMPLLTAELLYTAVTRARSKVVVQGSEAVISRTAARRVKRASGISGRIQETSGI